MNEWKLEQSRKAKSYIFPLIANIVKIPDHKLVNVFVRHSKHPNLDEHIFCVFEWSSNEIDRNVEDRLMAHPLCELHEDINNRYYLIGFKIPEELTTDYYLFIHGKYSLMSVKSKEIITRYYKLSKDHPVSMVLNRDKRLKLKIEDHLNVKLRSDSELSSIIDIDYETFDPSLVEISDNPEEAL